MKKKVQHLILIFTMIILASCGSNKKETLEDSAAKADSTTRADSIAIETRKAEARVAKRAKLAKESAEKAEQRKLAATEKVKSSLVYKDAAGHTVYYKADEDPSYTGGESEMRKYLHDTIKYPQSALDQQIEGTVFVDFIVNEKGQVRDVVASDVVGDVDLALKEEAVRVVAAMPAWVAGRHKGKAVDTAFSIPITFELLN